MKCFRTVVFLAAIILPAVVRAQTVPAAAGATDPDSRVDVLQPDFNIAALPTTLRMPVHKTAFRVTHRFSRPLAEGDFSDLASDFFGFDSGAQIGLELRYGLARGTQVGVHRTSNRTMQLFGQHNLLLERNGKPLGLDVMATFEGSNNLRTRYKSAVGVVASRNLGRLAALYAEPFVVFNSSPATNQGFDNHSVLLGLGGRLRIRPSTYLVGEITPRLAGFTPGVSQASLGLEGRAGGHLFQLNFSNGFGTTLGQIADGAFSNDDWYIGFNIARKFF